MVKLNYQKIVAGKGVGRYIDQEDKGDIVDEHVHFEVDMQNARELSEEPSLETNGFQLRSNPTKVKNFQDDQEVKEVYYKEIEDLILKSTGAKKVFIFDHTVRKSSVTKLNNLGAAGEAAGSVVRVHCDYTQDSAPRRFQ